MNQIILFTCAGRRNYLINYIEEAINGNGNIVAADQDLSAPTLIDADISIKISNINDSDYEVILTF